ncbi:MAG: methyltransferase, partial [Verrucomicrobia bacterium]|nr:methyltransferase [Verrucomicrobiota bacterium]
VWEKDRYELPPGEEIVYLDPGMAFGTGNHETTRLCVRRLLDARDDWVGEAPRKSVIDAGCGSGILAISARKLGFREIFAFDNDPDSVRISLDNARLCSVENTIEFRWADLRAGLADRSVDLLLANILSPVLCAHAGLLIAALRPGGRLVLSGILDKEKHEVHGTFTEVLGQPGHPLDSRTDGDWADLCYQLPVG